MHEFSIVQSLLELVEEQARVYKAKEVKVIQLLVGVLSGVEPHLLELAFETIKEGTVAQRAELRIEVERLKLYCRECGKESEKEELNALCPHCQSLNTEIRGGQELLLKSLELEV
ncbi:MAG: hydrogenase maturation nickel metallochaperone HypA [Acidobacteria bacterium]|jgi:hydrogenase nickel incorporation protein HypA/HybF|nr:MAG: hydrogenase maturation nickel metallochaperone HypA [Acidobacteriota bacterium]